MKFFLIIFFSFILANPALSKGEGERPSPVSETKKTGTTINNQNKPEEGKAPKIVSIADIESLSIKEIMKKSKDERKQIRKSALEAYTQCRKDSEHRAKNPDQCNHYKDITQKINPADKKKKKKNKKKKTTDGKFFFGLIDW